MVINNLTILIHANTILTHANPNSPAHMKALHVTNIMTCIISSSFSPGEEFWSVCGGLGVDNVATVTQEEGGANQALAHLSVQHLVAWGRLLALCGGGRGEGWEGVCVCVCVCVCVRRIMYYTDMVYMYMYNFATRKKQFCNCTCTTHNNYILHVRTAHLAGSDDAQPCDGVVVAVEHAPLEGEEGGRGTMEVGRPASEREGQRLVTHWGTVVLVGLEDTAGREGGREMDKAQFGIMPKG